MNNIYIKSIIILYLSRVKFSQSYYKGVSVNCGFKGEVPAILRFLKGIETDDENAIELGLSLKGPIKDNRPGSKPLQILRTFNKTMGELYEPANMARKMQDPKKNTKRIVDPPKSVSGISYNEFGGKIMEI